MSEGSKIILLTCVLAIATLTTVITLMVSALRPDLPEECAALKACVEQSSRDEMSCSSQLHTPKSAVKFYYRTNGQCAEVTQ